MYNDFSEKQKYSVMGMYVIYYTYILTFLLEGCKLTYVIMSQNHLTKGQLISKGLFVLFSILQKIELG